MVRAYRLVLSPALGGNCRFAPSCSVFAEEALSALPLRSALWRITKRLASCHPWHPGGYDPLCSPVKASSDP